MLLFGGLLLNFETIPEYIRWIRSDASTIVSLRLLGCRYLSFLGFANEALLSNELAGSFITIDVSEASSGVVLCMCS